MPDHHLAQLNVGRIVQPLDHPDIDEFRLALDPINALAEATPGFVWRLTDDDGASSSYVDGGTDDPLMLVNLSVWEDWDSLKHFLYRTGHVAYLRRRREWFEASEQPTAVCWWLPAGTVPTVAEAWDRLDRLRADGPTDEAWPLTQPRPAPAPS